MNTIGIISYPRSGNTWMRQVVAGASGLTEDSVPDLHRTEFDTGEVIGGARFFKLHIRKFPTEDTRINGKPIDIEATHVFHIRRNPLDVFLSYLNQRAKGRAPRTPIVYDNVDELVGTELMDVYLDHFIVGGHLAKPGFANICGDYYDHNQAWLKRANDNPAVISVRYEDLLQDPLEQLAFLTEWTDLTPEQIQVGLDSTKPKEDRNKAFYWKMKSGNFREYLSEAQIERFLRYREKEAEAFGYDRSFFLT